jgi:transposase
MVYNRFNRWAKRGVWLRIFEALAAKSPQSLQLIDSSIIRAHQHAAGGKKGPDNAIGRSRGGLSTKINAVVDQAGMPVRIVLSQGQSSDKTVAPSLIEGLAPQRDLIADRGCDARAIIELVERRGGRAHIRTCRDRKVQRSVDRELYRGPCSARRG